VRFFIAELARPVVELVDQVLALVGLGLARAQILLVELLVYRRVVAVRLALLPPLQLIHLLLLQPR
jgi:hypothetical protein